MVVPSGGARPSPALWARGLHELGLVGSLLGVDLIHQVPLTQVLTTVHLNLGEQWVHIYKNRYTQTQRHGTKIRVLVHVHVHVHILALYMYMQISYMMKTTSEYY